MRDQEFWRKEREEMERDEEERRAWQEEMMWEREQCWDVVIYRALGADRVDQGGVAFCAEAARLLLFRPVNLEDLAAFLQSYQKLADNLPTLLYR